MIYRTLIVILLAVAASFGPKPVSAQPHAGHGAESKRVTRVSAPRKHHAADTVGVVNGVVITYSDFNSILSGYIRDFVERSRDSVVSDSVYTILVDSTWRKAIADILVEREIRKRKLGLNDSATRAILLADPPPIIKQQFTDSSGVFYPNELRRALQDPRNDSMVRIFLAAYRIQLETERLITSISSKSKDPADAWEAYQAWLKKSAAASRIVDRRTMFGFY